LKRRPACFTNSKEYFLKKIKKSLHPVTQRLFLSKCNLGTQHAPSQRLKTNFVLCHLVRRDKLLDVIAN
jgi:hypothetical protein